MITSPQIRAARALLGWDRRGLADAAGVSIQTLRRIEPGHDFPSCKPETIQRIEAALDRHGIVFIGGGNSAEGVAQRPRPLGERARSRKGRINSDNRDLKLLLDRFKELRKRLDHEEDPTRATPRPVE